MFLAECEDVVSNDVVAAVMLMETGAFAAIDDIVLQNNVAAAFVGVEAPATVGEGVHIVNEIILNDRAALDAERVNSAHVAQKKLADVVKVIELHDILTAG